MALTNDEIPSPGGKVAREDDDTNPSGAKGRYALRSKIPPEQHFTDQSLFLHLLKQIQTATKHTIISFDDISPATGSLVTASLRADPLVESRSHRIDFNSFTHLLYVEVMPDFVHDAPSAWLIAETSHLLASGFLTPQEFGAIACCAGTTITGFRPPYENSSKEPDFYVLPDSNELPSVVVESGWSEATSKLNQDKTLWLSGGRGQVRKVIISRFRKEGGQRLSGWIEVWALDQNGTEQLLQHENIWPAPANATTQTIMLTRGDILGNSLPPNRNAHDQATLSINRLRERSERFVTREGWVPV